MKVFSITFFSILLFATVRLHAQLPPDIYSECDFCLCSMGISPLTMSGSAIRFDSRYTELSQEYSNGTQVNNPANEKETYFTNVLSLTGQVTDGLSATLMVPFAHKTESSNDPVNSLANLSNSGVGDISLLLRYNLLADHGGSSAMSESILSNANMRILAATAGIKFANGSTALTYLAQPADPDIQLGTGTTDFFAGLGYVLCFDNWNIEADALASIRGFGSGAAGHVYGDNVNYDITGTYRIHQNASFIPSLLDPSAFLSFGLRGEWRGEEKQNGQPLDNDLLGWSGGNVVYAAPGFQLFFTPRVSLDAAVWLPVIHALHGDQLGETLKVLAGIQTGI